ncbi:hypothetical protein SARC_00264 [Sphaeroforma arctica JP610]|uniref:Exportin-7/Ran-binding protein 17 TPR repeats domain-containing protein n=1 Tax=Sphaeroforma arctica JP610 TaxID=667725 RepID=A0A0L0GH30_9EUKA|nr:hypothetical protein SARC_00264 [Sphaeroforma arctica JP610]KNC87633.1 hypothetical protein SARC_00264 [Sphaeroforma arctica JP610]|eukprot:XP_014161535.1 hypothetical protein SARC_00264 [Sphaeroforma arctica JP610]
MDGSLCCNVLQLMRICDSVSVTSSDLEYAIIVFFKQFSKMYIGSHVQKSTKVDDDMLHHLDLLENHPDGYIRRVTQLHFDDPHVPKEAQAYFFHSFRANVLPPHPTGLPMYESFTLEHVEAYTPRHLRPPNNGFWPVIYAALR